MYTVPLVTIPFLVEYTLSPSLTVHTISTDSVTRTKPVTDAMDEDSTAIRQNQTSGVRQSREKTEASLRAKIVTQPNTGLCKKRYQAKLNINQLADTAPARKDLSLAIDHSQHCSSTERQHLPIMPKSQNWSERQFMGELAISVNMEYTDLTRSVRRICQCAEPAVPRSGQ